MVIGSIVVGVFETYLGFEMDQKQKKMPLYFNGSVIVSDLDQGRHFTFWMFI